MLILATILPNIECLIPLFDNIFATVVPPVVKCCRTIKFTINAKHQAPSYSVFNIFMYSKRPGYYTV